MVVDSIDTSLLRELVGDQGTFREKETEEIESSDLTELESGEEEEENEEAERKRSRRPNFVRAATGVGRRMESTQDFFRRGNKTDDNPFATTGKSAMRGALARSLSVAASGSPQPAGTAET